jgi:hypothetical protein
MRVDMVSVERHSCLMNCVCPTPRCFATPVH